MLIQQLFASGIMRMGPSKHDSERQVGVFNPEYLAALPTLGAAEMKRFHWLAGEWSHENAVPATALSPAYVDIGISRFSLSKDGTFLCLLGPDGGETPHITFDPFSRQWIYMLVRGSYGILRSERGWVDERIVFTGPMTMLGIHCEWRMSWTRRGDDECSFTNEEQLDDGSWVYIDEWHLQRRF